MTRVEITLGLLSILGVIAITALVGIGEFGEEGRMARASRGFDVRSVEAGAQMFDQYCASCHGFNASGLNCPPLDETSGLHGGDLGEGIAWRLEEMNWSRSDAYGYVYSSIAAGKTVSTRPDRYPAQDPNAMAMPPWSEEYAGPLRGDQIHDITNYIVNFRSYFPDASDSEAMVKACRATLDDVAPSNPDYQSKCYETVCRADLEEAGRAEEFEDAPKLPNLAETDDDGELMFQNAEGNPNAAYRAAVAEYDRYWDRFWAACRSVGAQLPPTQEPTAEPTAEATETADDDADDAETDGDDADTDDTDTDDGESTDAEDSAEDEDDEG